jgi:hypothetical protein
MSANLVERIIGAARQELIGGLEHLRHEVGAAECSLLAPATANKLRFFASTNPVLLAPETPLTPVNASYTGVAFLTGQTIAVADAAAQGQHFKAVDAATGQKTREFAAIPVIAGATLAVLTLYNRTHPTEAPSPFTLAELRRGEVFAREAAAVFSRLPGLVGAADGPAKDAVAAELIAELSRLSAGERRIVAALVDALVENRDRQQ